MTITPTVMVKEDYENKVQENKTLKFCHHVKVGIMESKSMLYAIMDGSTPKLSKALCSRGY